MAKNIKRVSRHFLNKLWNEKDKYVIDELIADNFVDHTPPPSSGDISTPGPDFYKQVYTAIQNELFNIHVSIKDQIAEGDKVVTHIAWEFTLKSNDKPPVAGKVITATGVGIDRIEGGKIVENWNTLDVLFRLINALGLPDPFSDPNTPTPPISCSAGCGPGYYCDRTNLCQRV